MSTEPAPRVYTAIAAVMSDIGREGIAKGHSNQQQGYKFRGIDDVYNALSPILSRHGLCMLPRVLSREVAERTTAKGTVLFYVTVEAEFDLVSSEDGSRHTIRTVGEAMDSGDKATNKAMSAAYKYAAMQAFAIPTEGDNDADATTHDDVAPATIPKAKARDLYAEMQAEIDACPTLGDLAGLWNSPAFKTEFKKLPADWQENLTARKDELKASLTTAMANGAVAVPPNFDRLESQQ